MDQGNRLAALPLEKIAPSCVRTPACPVHALATPGRAPARSFVLGNRPHLDAPDLGSRIPEATRTASARSRASVSCVRCCRRRAPHDHHSRLGNKHLDLDVGCKPIGAGDRQFTRVRRARPVILPRYRLKLGTLMFHCNDVLGARSGELRGPFDRPADHLAQPRRNGGLQGQRQQAGGHGQSCQAAQRAASSGRDPIAARAGVIA